MSKHIGTNFDDFLKDERITKIEVNIRKEAEKRMREIIEWQDKYIFTHLPEETLKKLKNKIDEELKRRGLLNDDFDLEPLGCHGCDDW